MLPQQCTKQEGYARRFYSWKYTLKLGHVLGMMTHTCSLSTQKTEDSLTILWDPISWININVFEWGAFVLLSVIYSLVAFIAFGVILENFSFGQQTSTRYFSWQLSTAFSLFGYFLFFPAILSFLFSNLSLQRVCIQRTSSSSQYLFILRSYPVAQFSQWVIKTDG